MPEQRLRVASYAVCLDEDRLLLARYVSPEGAEQYWTLPGGGVEHAEDPHDAVIRGVAEETGYQVEVEQLLPDPEGGLGHPRRRRAPQCGGLLPSAGHRR